MSTLWEDSIRAGRLVSLPEIYFKLKKILDDPDFTMADISEVISHDPGITFRLLAIANSSLYGFEKKVTTVNRAITLLGIQQVHDLVLATAVVSAFKGLSTEIMDMYRFWQNSVYCGIASRQLASLCNHYNYEFLFVAGILHDIGHLIMYQVAPELSQKAMEKAQAKNLPLFETEWSLFGFDYGMLGSEMMQAWSLPENLVEVTKHHVAPGKGAEFALEIALVHIGSVMAKQYTQGGKINEGILQLDEKAWQTTGLSPDDYKKIREKVEEETNEVVHLIYSQEPS